jgi:filamentous hemagglutinin family protein
MSGKSTHWYWLQGLGITITSTIVFWSNCSLAQITPDATLPSNSNVRQEGNTSIIEAGTQAGNNLFHSFQEFSVPTGGTAFFNNPTDVQNIISRVTGGSVSNIDGLIRANGTANLFLINPRGIIFGQNARLDISGSFVGSTASSLKFADGFEFSATVPQRTPLLTINTPIGLQFQGNLSSIQIRGDGQGLRENSDLIDTTTGLRVSGNQTLALLGGDLILEGATLKTAGGRIELGSVAGDDLVNLISTDKGFAFNYEGVQNLGNIQLSQQSAVDASGTGGGNIQVVGRRIAIASGSQIETSTLGAEAGKALVVNASELLDVIGMSAQGLPSAIGGIVYPGASGNAGDLKINTGELLIRDGAQIGASTFGSGRGGNVTITANKIQVIGKSGSASFNSSLAATAEAGSTGEAGSLTINTGELVIRDGAFISVSTRGAGKAGDLSITADSVQVIGISADGQLITTIGASSNQGATGDAGSLTITTKKLLIQNGGRVQTFTFTGKGGRLTVNANKVEVIGTGTTVIGQLPSNINAVTRGRGNAGNVIINTQQLLVKDGAGIVVQSLGTGNAGNLNIDAGSVRLDNGILTANTRSVNTDPNQPQATITLRVKDLVLLRRNSNITANAAGSNVIGGDINIDTDFLVAIENSDISANSTDFRGGRVRIEALSILGTQSRNERTPESDITARGKTPELSGTVELNTVDVDPSRGLVELPVNLVDASEQIAQGCTPRRGQTNSFVVTGRTGLPLSPSEPLRQRAVITQWVTLDEEIGNETDIQAKPNLAENQQPIIEAQGWVVDERGNVQLVAQVANEMRIQESGVRSQNKFCTQNRKISLSYPSGVGSISHTKPSPGSNSTSI